MFRFSSGSYNPVTADDWRRAAEFWQSESESFAKSDQSYARFCRTMSLDCASRADELSTTETLEAGHGET